METDPTSKHSQPNGTSAAAGEQPRWSYDSSTDRLQLMLRRSTDEEVIDAGSGLTLAFDSVRKTCVRMTLDDVHEHLGLPPEVRLEQGPACPDAVEAITKGPSAAELGVEAFVQELIRLMFSITGLRPVQKR